MVFSPFEVTTPHVIYACLGAFVVLFGMFSLFLREKLYIGEACWAFLFGVIIGPYGADIFNPHKWGGGSEDITNTITLEFTRVVLAIGVFAIGVELPKAYMARHWKSIMFLLVPVMTWGWFVSAGLIFAFIPGLNFLSSLAVAACLTPTDPILAAAVVGGKWADKHVPAHLRHLLAAESGCNDGAAFPFLFISLYLLLDAPHTGFAMRDWFLILWLYQVILGIVIGGLIGFGFRHLMKFCQRRNLIDRHSYVAQYISLAILTIGVTTLLGSDDLLAAFACGTAFAWDGFFNHQTEESVFSSVIDLLFNIAAFVYVGAWMPFGSFQNAELTLSVWRLIVIALLVLILRRLPIMIALYKWIPDIKTFREAVFSGHFGPIGIGAIFISTLANEAILKDKHPHDEQLQLLSDTIQPIVAFMVLCSITIHGLSIPSLSLGRRVNTLSRTWSRHAAAPDWTNQARLVDRGDDIIINRDNNMERGELPGEKMPESGTLASRSPSVEVSTPEKQSEDDGSLETKMEEVPVKPGTPEGPATFTEWKEPHHRIVERQASPGEDVDVEVTAEENPDASVATRIRHSLKLLDGLKKNAGHLEDHTGASVEGKVAEIESHIKEVLSTDGNKGQQITDEEEGWTSDQSHADQQASSSHPDPKRRSKSSILKSQPVGSGRRGRQRTSLKRVQAQAFMHPENDPESSTAFPPSPPDDSEGRGRSPVLIAYPKRPPPSAGSSSYTTGSRPRTLDRSLRPGTADSTLRNNRLDHIRALHSSPPTREASPSRSIRFMDESVTFSDSPDSAGVRVTFDVPKSPIDGKAGV